MSSDEDSHDTDKGKAHKKRRLRACDMCRRRKVRCDGGQMPGNACSNCIAFKYKCTYVETAVKRVPDAGYVESLETQLAEMRKTLNKYRQLMPNLDVNEDPNTREDTPDAQSPFAEERASMSPRPHTRPRGLGTSALAPATPISSPPIDADDLDPSDDEISLRKSLSRGFEDLHLNPHNEHFLGKSSSLVFLSTALDMKKEYVNPTRDDTENGGDSQEPPTLMPHKRPEFWNEHPWVMQSIALNEQPSILEFPEPDLIQSLSDIYFHESNIHMPLLHRPTYYQGIQDKLHLQDISFGCVVLLVCAVGARYSDDPRVVLEEELGKRGHRKHSAGWKWFVQVQRIKSLFSLAPPRLYDLQLVCLASIFIHGTSTPHIAWGYIGIGLRYAQDLGAHRKKAYNLIPSVEDEQLKRAFWVLVLMDRSLSSVLGRPCAIQDEDFDVDLCIECDDEYWINPDPKLAFKQPEGKPSTVVFFNCAIRLSQIHAFALRTIYSINKSKALLGFVGEQWEQHIVAELDSALNKWIDAVPDHLRWNPHMEDAVFMCQSAHLYASYYLLQITVHRPFIPSPRKPSGVSFPSLAICTNAARSCVHVLDVQAKRAGVTSYLNQMPLFSSGIVLLLNIWGAKRSGSVADPVKEMAEVHKCMNMLKGLEPRWLTAGRVWDVLYDLANVGNLPLPERDTTPSHKRSRGSEGSAMGSPTPEEYASPQLRHIAGSKRVQQYQHTSNSSNTFTPSPVLFSLPIHSDELGRLPLHPFFQPNTTPDQPMGSPEPPPQWVPQPFASLNPPAPDPANISGNAIDSATLEALFRMLPPTSYQVPLAPGAAPNSQDFSPVDSMSSSQSQSLASVLSENIGSMMAHTNAQISADSAGQCSGFAPADSIESDTLAIWSNAPSSFEWDDWNTYVTNFGGSAGPGMGGAGNG